MLSVRTQAVLLCVTATIPVYAAVGGTFPVDLGHGTKAALRSSDGTWQSLRPPSGGDLAAGRRQALVEVCDLRAGVQFVPVRGRVDAKGVMRAQLADAGLGVETAIRQRDGHVRVDVTVTNRGDADRGLVVRVCVPVDAVGWQWWDDVQAPRRIAAGAVYQNTQPIRHFADLPEFRDRPAAKLGFHSRNFCAAVSGSAGLAMAFPLDQPRICRFAYNAKERLLYLAFDLALNRHTRPPNQAIVSALLYACDPHWGLRGALSQYYAWYPPFFAKHVKREGTWMAFSDLAEIDNAGEFGFQFQEGAANPGYDDKLGVYSYTYFTHAGLFAWIPDYDPEKDPAPSRERVLAAMTKRFERDTRIKGTFQDVGLGLPNGELEVRPMTVYGHLISQFNPDPELPYGRWQLGRIDATFDRFRKRGGELDGFYYDGLTSGLNYRTDHFAHADYPPIWDPVAKKPVLYNYFSAVEFAKETCRRLHAAGKHTMMNGAMASSPFAAPYLDVMGAETGLRIARRSFNYVRMICGSKPFVTLLKGNFSTYTHDDIELFMRRCVAYGVYPGFFDWSPSGLGPGSRYWEHAEWYERDRLLFRRYVPLVRDLATAGWDPLTHAVHTSSSVEVERFGGAGRPCFFTLLNDTSDTVAGALTIDAKALRIDPNTVVVVDEVARAAIARGGLPGQLIVPTQLGPGQLVVLHVSDPRAFAAHHVTAVGRLLDDRKRMAELDRGRPEFLVHWRRSRGGYGRGTGPTGSCLALEGGDGRRQQAAWQWVMLYQRQPRPLEIRARVKVDGIKGKPGARFALHATVCHVTRFTKRVKHVFPLPTDASDWRAVRFVIEPLRPVRSIQLTVMLDRVRGRALVDDVVVAEVDKPDVNHVVDSGMEQWYEQPSDALATELDRQFDRLGKAVAGITAPESQRNVIAACGKAMAQIGSLRAGIESKGRLGACRRALRDLDDCQSHLQLVATTLARVTGPTIRIMPAAIPGRSFTLSIEATLAGRPAALADVTLDVPAGWRSEPLESDVKAARRFRVHVPREAPIGQVVRLAATANVKVADDLWMKLAATRRTPVVRAVDATLVVFGDAEVALVVTNNCAKPLAVRYDVAVPEGWHPAPRHGEVPCPSGRSLRSVIQLGVPATASPGERRVGVALRSADGAFESRTLEGTVLVVPGRLNLVKNAGFEEVRDGRPVGWAPYTDGCEIDETVAHSGRHSLKLANPEPAKRGATQTIRLDQKRRCPILVRAWSKAKAVGSDAGRDYSLYVDIYYADGSALYGQTIQFGTGTHDWEFGERLIEPQKPVRNVNVYALHRRATGTAWFDDVVVAELPSRKGNLAGAATIRVDSFFSDYKAGPLVDGVTETAGLHWTEAAWASAETNKPHWIELAFDEPVSVKRVVVHWSLDADVARTSTEFAIQAASNGGWRDLQRARPAGPEPVTAVVLAKPVSTARLRIWQPAGGGPSGRPGLMWVRELEVFSH